MSCLRRSMLQDLYLINQTLFPSLRWNYLLSSSRMCLPYKNRSSITINSNFHRPARLLQRPGSKGDVRSAINGAQLTALLIPELDAREESGPSFVFKSVPERSRKRANDRLGSSPSKHNFLATASVVVVDPPCFATDDDDDNDDDPARSSLR